MANEKELTKLYKVRNGYAVMKGNQVIKEGNVALTDKEHALQSWKVEEIINVSTPSAQEDNNLSEENFPEKPIEPNIDRSVKKSKFNRAVKTPKG